ncbi:hypothetical protein [Deinococcus gobiensis]|uniref:Uncharacterized protein n=1 Tax=Deinococcus gobiensis (strain DSM 21396 / JCM 16679 / CGMCC 1.7299 / I-0) TaxID=745776 RepID=H8H1M0_DEIGI|nr:hypothetical protein [Deinococcus gobiensis]AFD27417.1 hypothetical protein DGo_PB0148 [Deinococcus gobiensis I-0]
MLDPQLKADLLLMVRTHRVSAYDLARGLLDILGLASFETAVQALPTSCPKTLRRIFSQGVPMCRSDLPKEAQEHRDTLEMDVNLTALAGQAKVDATQALSAVLRYGNPIARVMGVLEDIRALVRHDCRVFNPTGLFVRLMRSGEDVRLPARVRARREVQQERDPQEPLPLPCLGEWVKYQGDWLIVEAILERKIRLYAPPGRHYHYFVANADTDVPFEQARALPRRATPPEERPSARMAVTVT